MRASAESGGRSRSQHSQLGRSSSIASTGNWGAHPAGESCQGQAAFAMTGRSQCGRGSAFMSDRTPVLLGMSGSLRSGSYSNAILETLREIFAGRADLRVYDLAPI